MLSAGAPYFSHHTCWALWSAGKRGRKVRRFRRASLKDLTGRCAAEHGPAEELEAAFSSVGKADATSLPFPLLVLSHCRVALSESGATATRGVNPSFRIRLSFLPLSLGGVKGRENVATPTGSRALRSASSSRTSAGDRLTQEASLYACGQRRQDEG